MNKVFDVVETINERIRKYVSCAGSSPKAILLSPASYRRLLEINSVDQEIGDLLIGCIPLRSFTTAWGNIRVVIDEMLGDTDDVEIS